MNGWDVTLITFLSVMAYQVRFFSMILSFLKTFIAYNFPLSFFSTKNTSPKLPDPSSFKTVKFWGPWTVFIEILGIGLWIATFQSSWVLSWKRSLKSREEYSVFSSVGCSGVLERSRFYLMLFRFFITSDFFSPDCCNKSPGNFLKIVISF